MAVFEPPTTPNLEPRPEGAEAETDAVSSETSVLTPLVAMTAGVALARQGSPQGLYSRLTVQP